MSEETVILKYPGVEVINISVIGTVYYRYFLFSPHFAWKDGTEARINYSGESWVVDHMKTRRNF